MNGAADFERYVGIDYSGAQTPVSSRKGLRVFMAAAGAVPSEVHPPPSQRKYWTRRGVAEWLAEQLLTPQPTLVGIDHGFSFPLQYFQQHGVPLDWTAFLEDFHRHWPTDLDSVYVDFVRDGTFGNGAERSGDARWRRLTEVRARAAKSVFHFDVQGSVAKSTHSGLPWLLHLRRSLAGRIHFWPFDGWVIPPGRSAVVEVYPSLWSRSFPTEGRDKDQHDAYSVALWMQRTDQKGRTPRIPAAAADGARSGDGRDRRLDSRRRLAPPHPRGAPAANAEGPCAQTPAASPGDSIA